MSEPLASLLRPQSLATFWGQQHLVGKDAPIFKLIESKTPASMIFWGPPGVGKTTLARIFASGMEADFYELSAVTTGKADLQKIAQQGSTNGRPKILFIDEIHRWSKTQQDVLLPLVEKGDISLIGATTENPSFTIIAPLLSRARVFVFNKLTAAEILPALKLATKELAVTVKTELLQKLADEAHGDVRFAINALELATKLKRGKSISLEDIEAACQKSLKYDRNGEEHYNLISALHKSLRSSSPSAAAYWCLRMLRAGEDPLYIARRMLRFASEDIGNANPNALLLANVVFDTCQKLGVPECDTALVQLAEYMANSKKSNAAYRAVGMIDNDIKQYGDLEVPMHLRNAPTKLMKEVGYSKGYEYDPDLASGKSGQQTLPDKLKNKKYFAN
jgi:putative ATPase